MKLGPKFFEVLQNQGIIVEGPFIFTPNEEIEKIVKGFVLKIEKAKKDVSKSKLKFP